MMKPNAECPVCHDTWRIVHYATLTEDEGQKIKINGVLLVVCEDCDNGNIDWDSEEAAEWSSAY